MDVTGALDLLSLMRPANVELSAETGLRHDAAYLRIWQPARPDRWGVVCTPGDRWFALQVDGGFSLDHFEEDTDDEDVRRLLSNYVDLAVTYVRGDITAAKTGPLRSPRVTLPTNNGPVDLRMSVLAGFRAAITPSR
ncbi:hypothetical protein ACI3KX_10095 [Microbacterium sp. ZW CA_36]|uniref:hypothetical protein n=1 Tax=Microbacterium sp. ZW CA_36 TaxID=3378078 RepID=UPI00385202B6